MHLTVFKQIQTNSCHWYQLCRMSAASVAFRNRKYAPGQQPPCLRSTHTPQILCTGWPGGTSSHPIICQKDDWYKTALRNESSIRALSPSQNDNYWFLLCGVHPREKTSRQNKTVSYGTLAVPADARGNRRGRGHAQPAESFHSGTCFPAAQFLPQFPHEKHPASSSSPCRTDLQSPTRLQDSLYIFVLFIGF